MLTSSSNSEQELVSCKPEIAQDDVIENYLETVSALHVFKILARRYNKLNKGYLLKICTVLTDIFAHFYHCNLALTSPVCASFSCLLPFWENKL